MEYKNETSEDKMVQRGSHSNDWATVKAGETKDLDISESFAAKYGLVPIKAEPEVKAIESSIGDTKVETKVKRRKKK